MTDITYFDRNTKQYEKEHVYGAVFLHCLYGNGFFCRVLSFFILPLIAKISIFSKFYGWLQKRSSSLHKVRPFIKKFQVDATEFRDPVMSFTSFNDFFIRHLKPQCRPFAVEDNTAILPADARYLVYQNYAECPGIFVKEKTFSLEKLLQSSSLAERYKEGGLLIARLCPVDYHRYHFPCDAKPSQPMLINGPLYSVNPIALKRNIEYLTENKRYITELETKHFGKVLYLEIGATYVGAIHHTSSVDKPVKKGDEKGYFSFGGSCLILLFEPNTIQFDQDLLEQTSKGFEVRGLLGQSLGHSI